MAVGVEIGGPLLQVGRNVQAMKGQLRAEQAKNKELREQIEQLNRRLVPMQNGDGRRDEIQPSGIQPQAPVQGTFTYILAFGRKKLMISQSICILAYLYTNWVQWHHHRWARRDKSHKFSLGLIL